MEELEHYLEGNPHLSKNSKRAYTHAYQKIMTVTPKMIKNIPQGELISKIENLSSSPNSFNQLLNVAIQIRRFNREPVQMLLNRREKNQFFIDQHKDKINAEKEKVLPTLPVLIASMNRAFMERRFYDYIIQFLLLTFSTRNKDLDCVIVSRKSQAKDKSENYLILRKNDICFVRNNYKTAATYGKKENCFKNKRLRKAIIHHIEKQTGEPYVFPHYSRVHLLATKDNKRVKEDSIHSFIRKSTFQNLTESDYFKVAVSRIKSLGGGGYKALKEMSANRGTQVDTILAEYNILLKRME